MKTEYKVEILNGICVYVWGSGRDGVGGSIREFYTRVIQLMSLKDVV